MLRIAPWARSLAALALASAIAIPIANAGTTGKLSGKIVNEKKEALVGANVRVEGQRLGAVTDEQGNYVILGIPAGVYTVRVNMLGHGLYAATNVSIPPDFTTELNVTLKTEAVEMAEVRVDAERPLLQKDATGTTRFIASEDIQKLPTRGYRDAAAQQTGVVNFQRQIDNEVQNSNTLIIRGGRPNETAYFVDGFSQQDPLTGTSSTSISNNAIEEIVLMTGGFAPEYGRIMSGAVNVITREGASKYFGAVEGITDNLSGDWVQAAKTDYNVYDASLGGPIWPGNDDLTFYFSGERRWQRDRSPTFLADVTRERFTQLGLDPDIKPNNGSAGYTYQGKIAWQVNNQMNLKLGGLGSSEDWQQFLNTYLFNLDHTPRYEDRNQSYFGSFNHSLNTKSFYNVGVNFFQTERKRGDGVHFDDLDAYFRAQNPRFEITEPHFWSVGHVFDDYLQRNSSYYGAQASYSSQVTPHHQLKVGGDFQRHTLRLFNHFFPVQLGGSNPNLRDFDAYGYDLVVARDGAGNITDIRLEENDDSDQDGPKHPKSISFFAQDKFEREGVIVNGGLRFDYINTDTPALLSDRFPLGDPESVGNIPDSLETQDLIANKTYTRVSPRLGVAFPVDEKTLLRFNYGQFYQQPNLQDLYVSYRFLQHKVRTGGYFVGFGNPNLRPELTTAYEVGIARQIGDNVRVDFTAYYKDVKDLVEISSIASFPNSFSSYRNRDFATIKGIDLGFTMRPINRIAASMNYSLSYAQGTGSVSNTQRNIAWQATEPPKQTSPLDFDQRHKLSTNIDWRLGKDEGPTLGGYRWLQSTGINVLYNVASGTPYTPTFTYDEVTLAAVAGVPSGPLNSRYGPWTHTLDLKGSKGFGFSGLDFEAFAWVLNLFDNENPFTVYSSSGAPSSTSWLNTEDGQNYAANSPEGDALYRLAENNPNLFSNPRMVRFGLRASF
ncbi:MAG TPA: TonB-dependent receptor [Candidatus Limnocylindria bacterium]|nr:TonB-dependent receptor [Candidatus Limnocylindria bacterium]